MLSLIVCSLFASALAENWAVLVAGSNGFSNYRHQSDIFRTYKILTKNGFNPDNIITMCYDDIATSPSNPFPGKVYNVPDGPDVYIGSDLIDYKGKTVTAANFYAVLLGDEQTAKGKVLKSTKDDNVFIFYNDHGSKGLICFPTGGNAYADALSNVLKQMYTNQMYKNLVFYVEACYSGSMFQTYLPNNMSIYVTTAANEKESSWAEYCGIAKYKTCLSNEYSQAWEQHSDTVDLSTVTVGEQFEHVRAATKRSHVMDYGDLSIKSYKLIDFQGGNNQLPEEAKKVVEMIKPPTSGENPHWRKVRQTEAHMTYLKTAAQLDQFSNEAVEYHKELENKKMEADRTSKLAAFFGMTYPDPNYVEASSIDMDMYRRSIETYEEICGRLNEHNMWSNTVILSRAVSDHKLTAANFAAYEALLRSF